MSANQKGKSFHIAQQFGEAWVLMWPMSSLGQYTDSKSEALEELQHLRKNESKFRIVSYDAVRDENDDIIGLVQGTMREEEE